MAKKQLRTLALTLAVFALGSILMVACTRPGTSTGTASSGNSGSPTASSTSSGGGGSCASGDTVKTNATNFQQSLIAFTKGAPLKVIQHQPPFPTLTLL